MSIARKILPYFNVFNTQTVQLLYRKILKNPLAWQTAQQIKQNCVAQCVGKCSIISQTFIVEISIDKDVVDFTDNYDGTLKEPVLLPTTFPNILVNPNDGIAVGMSSTIASFNLIEICNTTIELIKNHDYRITNRK